MTDPTITSATSLSPINMQQYQSYLPNAFDDNLTLLQKVNKIINYLNGNQNPLNSIIDQWNNDIVTFVNSGGFQDDVNTKLDSMVSDGTLDSLINTNLIGSLSSLTTTDKSSVVNAINSVENDIKGMFTVNVKDYGVVGDGVTDDTANIQNAINNCPSNAILLFPIGTYLIKNSINITRSIIIKGEFATIKAGVNGLNNAFNISNTNDVTLYGIKFDMATIGRTSIAFTTCNNIKVLYCDVTGYSATYGWSSYDGGICVTNCYDVLIANNYFHQHGNQYDATTNTLNRCITIQGASSGSNGDRVKIYGNSFYQVNQAIVCDLGESNFISNNNFEEIHDNSLYMLDGCKGMVITGNTFNDKYDECLILSGGNVIVTGNHFRNLPNKFMGLTGDLASLIINGNTFDNTGTTTGSFFATRDTSYTIDFLLMTDNIFLHPNCDGTSYPFYFGNVTYFIIKDNIVSGSFGANIKITYFDGTTANGLFKDNYVKGSDSTSQALALASGMTGQQIIVQDNNLTLCRIPFSSNFIIKGHTIQANGTSLILQKNLNSIVYYSQAPTSGVWKQGDIVYNTSPLASGNIGWVCVASGDFSGTAPVFKTFGTIGT